MTMKPLHEICKLIVICSLGVFATPTIASESESLPKQVLTNEDVQRAFIQAKIVEHFPEDYSVMLAIAYCESRSRPFIHYESDGSLRGHDTGASTAGGTYQVLMGLHGDAIREMGLDMSNLDDYFTFVERLKRENPNYGAWSESKSCWKSRIGDFDPNVNIS
jgi:hypothetical protein